jgi:hypothetical protein
MKVEIYNTAEVTNSATEQKLEFALFTKEQSGVYGVVCPHKETVSPEKIVDYPLPDRVKDIVKMVELDKRFYMYEVWHSDAYEIKDPILVGRIKDPTNPTYNWYDKFYLIARWGEELQPFADLKKKAIEFMKEHSIASALKLKAMVNAYLENPDLFCKVAVEKGISQIGVPSFDCL